MANEQGSSSSGNNILGKKNPSVLIVDDDRTIRKVHKAILERVGFDAESVDNGQKAVDLHGQGKSFDVVFIDKDMPIKNGIQATKELRAMGVKSTIVGVTADTSEQEKQNFMEAGLNYFFSKPLRIEKARIIFAECSDI